MYKSLPRIFLNAAISVWDSKMFPVGLIPSARKFGYCLVLKEKRSTNFYPRIPYFRPPYKIVDLLSVPVGTEGTDTLSRI